MGRVFALWAALHSPPWVRHAPFTRSIVCRARPSGPDRDGSARSADCRRRVGVGVRYIPLRLHSLGDGCGVDVGCCDRNQECVPVGATVAEDL